MSISPSSVFTRLAAGVLAAASLTTLAVSAEAAKHPVRWKTGGAVWSTKSSAFKTFFADGEITDRGLQGGINNSGWTAEEIQEGMTRSAQLVDKPAVGMEAVIDLTVFKGAKYAAFKQAAAWAGVSDVGPLVG